MMRSAIVWVHEVLWNLRLVTVTYVCYVHRTNTYNNNNYNNIAWNKMNYSIGYRTMAINFILIQLYGTIKALAAGKWLFKLTKWLLFFLVWGVVFSQKWSSYSSLYFTSRMLLQSIQWQLTIPMSLFSTIFICLIHHLHISVKTWTNELFSER